MMFGFDVAASKHNAEARSQGPSRFMPASIRFFPQYFSLTERKDKDTEKCPHRASLFAENPDLRYSLCLCPQRGGHAGQGQAQEGRRTAPDTKQDLDHDLDN